MSDSDQSARLCEELCALRAAFSELYKENLRLRDGLEFARDFTTPGTIDGKPTQIRLADTMAYLRATSVPYQGTTEK